MKIGDVRRGMVTAQAFGGEGIFRDEGLVVFVPFVAPGDEVEVVITETKKSFARARLQRVLTRSPHRIQPVCKHFGTCGGCQLQHISYEAQLVAKHDFVEQSLRRLAKLSVEVLPVKGASIQWEYRRVVRLRFSEQAGLSYVDAASRGLVQVNHCPIFRKDSEVWGNLNDFVKAFKRGKLSVNRNADNTLVALLEVDTDAPAELPSCLAGCIIKTPRSIRTLGNTELKFSAHGLLFSYSPMSFVQNHPEQSERLSSQVIETVMKTGARRVLDLYCGFGVTAIALASRGLEVVGIENNAESIRLAKDNAVRNAVNVKWICDDVGNRRKLLDGESFDSAVVNPPRVGLSADVCQALAKSRIENIVYVSCMPQTLARDLAILNESGYRITTCQPYDMFPQTTHVETLVVLSLTP